MITPSEKTDRNANRLVALSGFGFVILVIAAFSGLGEDTPGGGDPAEKVKAFYAAHQNHQMAAAFVLAAAVPLIVLFSVGLAQALWPVDPARRPFWQIVLIGGGVLAGATFASAALCHFVLADIAGKHAVSTGALQTLNELDSSSWMALDVGLGVLMLGAAGSLVPRGGAQRALGWLALITGVALFVPYADFPALVATGLWILAMSVVLFRGRREPAFAARPGLA
jgi:hypothetical protein